MRFDEDDYEDEYDYIEGNRFPAFPIVFGVLSFVVLMVLVVMLANGNFKQVTKKKITQKEVATIGDTMGIGNTTGTNGVMPSDSKSETNDDLISGSTLTADDLNFWGMYPEETEVPTTDKTQSVVVKPKPKEEKEEKEDDPSTDGKHVNVTLDDGTVEWLAINKSLPANNYDTTLFQKQDGILRYYRDHQNISYAGVTLNRYSGEVDFEALKKQGIAYAMIRVGSRGYDSGVITLDEKFTEYMQAAVAAGMDVGVYFASQAITPEEATEEVNFMVEQIAPYYVKYPVAVRMDVIKNDSARTDTMTKNERTAVLKAYMETLALGNYKPMLMGDKNLLLTKLDLSALTGFSIWLDKVGDLPEYPYSFQIWQYGDAEGLNGIDGNAKLNISMIDYSSR